MDALHAADPAVSGMFSFLPFTSEFPQKIRKNLVRAIVVRDMTFPGIRAPILPAVFTGEVLQPWDQPPLGWLQQGRVSRVTILLYPPQIGALAILQGRFEQNTRREASKVMQFHHSKTSPRSAHPPIPSFPVIVSLQDSVHTEPLTGCRKSRSHHSAEMKQEAWQGFSPAC